MRDGGVRGLRTWHPVGPKPGQPILLDCPQKRTRLTTYKAGGPGNRLGLWPGPWDKRPKMPAPPLKGTLLLQRKRSGLPALRLCLLLRSQPLAAPSPGPKDARLLSCLPAWGVRFLQGLRLPETTAMTLCWESWVVFPGLGHPLVQFFFLNLGLCFFPRSWEFGCSLLALSQPGAAPSLDFSQ